MQTNLLCSQHFARALRSPRRGQTKKKNKEFEVYVYKSQWMYTKQYKDESLTIVFNGKFDVYRCIPLFRLFAPQNRAIFDTICNEYCSDFGKKNTKQRLKTLSFINHFDCNEDE